MLFICYPKCSTCKKAQKWLDEKNIGYTYRDIKENNPSLEELSAWYEKSGLDIKRFFNTSGQLYKSMALKDKLPSMTVEEKLALLSGDGLLVKRPILVGDDFLLVGFKENEWEDTLNG
ncbi:MAG: arsenate reductase family protein [Ruminococcus sp.]|nr:arsenate reductase family protein [Ruminococcus sp.]